MKDILHFAKHSFLWNFKSFVILIILVMLTCLTLMGFFPDIASEPFLVFSIFLFFLSSSIILNNVAGEIGNQLILPDSFSGKYLQALPFSKKKLILTVVTSNIYTIAPCLLFAILINMRWKEGLVQFISLNNLLPLIILVIPFTLFLNVAMTLCCLFWSFNNQRMAYNKGRFSNFLLRLKSAVRYLASAFTFLVAFVYMIFQFNNLALTIGITIGIIGIIGVMVIYNALDFWHCYRLFLNERLSYWNTKRDLSSMGISVFFIFIAGAYVSKSIANNASFSFVPRIAECSQGATWRNFYSKGPQIFKDISNGKWKEVGQYISDGGEFDLVNENGVGLIHSLTLVNFDKVKGLEEEFLKDVGLLGKEIRTTKEGGCEFFYCDGVTPIHLLSARGNSKILNKALEKLPSSLELKTKRHETPLHYAAKLCAYRTTMDLIEKGANINAVNVLGNSSLMIASARGCLIVSTLLINKGADLNLKNNQGVTASELAKENEYKEIHFLLETFSKG